MNENHCLTAICGWPIAALNTVCAASTKSRPRKPTIGLSARVCFIASSAIASAAGASSAAFAIERLPLPGRLLRHQQRQGIRDQGWLVAVLDFNGVPGLDEELAVVLFVDIVEDDAQSDAPPGRHRRQKAHLVQAVVEAGRRVRRDDADVERQRTDQRQREIAVRDRSAEGTFPSGAVDIDVDPLTIAGAVGELVDPLLIHWRCHWCADSRHARGPLTPRGFGNIPGSAMAPARRFRRTLCCYGRHPSCRS